jgi:hypothetical protein
LSSTTAAGLIESTAHFRKPSRPMPRLAAARVASTEQEIPGHTETIEYEDDKGKWHMETARGRDRPHTAVKDVD